MMIFDKVRQDWLLIEYYNKLTAKTVGKSRSDEIIIKVSHFF